MLHTPPACPCPPCTCIHRLLHRSPCSPACPVSSPPLRCLALLGAPRDGGDRPLRSLSFLHNRPLSLLTAFPCRQMNASTPPRAAPPPQRDVAPPPLLLHYTSTLTCTRPVTSKSQNQIKPRKKRFCASATARLHQALLISAPSCPPACRFAPRYPHPRRALPSLLVAPLYT